MSWVADVSRCLGLMDMGSRDNSGSQSSNRRNCKYSLIPLVSPWAKSTPQNTSRGGIRKKLQRNGSRSTPCLTPDPDLRSQKSKSIGNTSDISTKLSSSPAGSSLDNLDQSTPPPKSSTSLPQEVFSNQSDITKSCDAISSKSDLTLDLKPLTKSCDNLSPEKEDIEEKSPRKEYSSYLNDSSDLNILSSNELFNQSLEFDASKIEFSSNNKIKNSTLTKSCEVLSPTRKLKCNLTLTYETLAQSCEVLSPDKDPQIEETLIKVSRPELTKSCEVLSPQSETPPYDDTLLNTPSRLRACSTSRLDCSVNYSDSPLRNGFDKSPTNKMQRGVFVAARDTLMTRLCGGEFRSPPLPASEHPSRVPKYTFSKGAPPCQRRAASRLSDSSVVSKGAWLGRHGRSRSEYFLGRTCSVSSSGSSGIWSHSSSGSIEWGNWSKDVLDRVPHQRVASSSQLSNIYLTRSRIGSEGSDDLQVSVYK